LLFICQAFLLKNDFAKAVTLIEKGILLLLDARDGD
jgi:hypothetical protein